LKPNLAYTLQEPLDLAVETHWEKAAKTKMGKYLTKLETDFISNSVILDKENLPILLIVHGIEKSNRHIGDDVRYH